LDHPDAYGMEGPGRVKALMLTRYERSGAVDFHLEVSRFNG
jgi:hypothetical protein